MSEMLNTEHILLDAVNILLNTINEPSIEAEEDFEIILEARQARDTLFEVKRAVLSEGWDFNRDTNYVFAIVPETGFIPVPTNVLDIVASQGDVIMRDWRLYSKGNQSHVFEEDVSCEVTWDMMFDSLSHPLRHYITIRAARIFTARVIGDEKSVSYTATDEEDARLAARRSESRTGKFNVLNSTYGVANKIERI